jgi:hypothetical protein
MSWIKDKFFYATGWIVLTVWNLLAKAHLVEPYDPE